MDNQTPAVPPAPETAPTKRILIVDDDAEFTGRLSEKIKAVGLTPIVMVTGKEALDYLVTNNVDFIILDFIMPGMDGYTFYHILKHDMRKDIPAIVLTNLSGGKDTEDLEVFIKTETDLDDLIGRIKTRV